MRDKISQIPVKVQKSVAGYGFMGIIQKARVVETMGGGKRLHVILRKNSMFNKEYYVRIIDEDTLELSTGFRVVMIIKRDRRKRV